MKKTIQKFTAFLLSAAILGSVSVPAFASEALGEDLTAQETVIHQDTALSTNVFWSSAYSDLRTENYVTYTPNREVTPIVTYGSVLRDQATVSDAARELEADGYRVVAGINGDFYNVSTGLPIGIVITDGLLRSSDGGYHAVGFRRDGSAVIGKPRVKVTADLGYRADDGSGTMIPVVRTIAGVNKARVSTGGIFLYTYDFNDRHTNGTIDPGVDVLCTMERGALAVGGELTLRVDEIRENSGAVEMGKDQVVLSANAQTSDYYCNALRNIPQGASITVRLEAADEKWNDVEYAVGALYGLLENGTVAQGLEKGVNPRTAVGVRPDGTVILYTIDGRRTGHSVGASLTQVAQRLLELGCTDAVCLDGGGSTTLAVTTPDSRESAAVNRPSGGKERAVSNQIFLVAEDDPSGRLDHFYIQPEATQVLAGSTVPFTVSAVDTHYIPMHHDFDLDVQNGELRVDSLVKTPRSGGTVTITASDGGRRDSVSLEAIAHPDQVGIRLNGSLLQELSVAPGSVTRLTATAAYRHLPLFADNQAFDWAFTGECGTIDPTTGDFTAIAPGTGSLTVSAGGRSATIPVTVSRVALKTVEDFEHSTTVLDGTGTGIIYYQNHTADQVRKGRVSGQLDYTLTPEWGYTADWYLNQPVNLNGDRYTALNLELYGDGSGNQLSFLYSQGAEGYQTLPVAKLDFTGWRTISLPLPGENVSLQGIRISAGEVSYVEDGLGGYVPAAPTTAVSGSIRLDQLVASFAGTVDTTVPEIRVELAEGGFRGGIRDLMDGIPARHSVQVTLDGAQVPFQYDSASGKLEIPFQSDGMAHRLTVTAMDASGNIGRASLDVPAAEGAEHFFTDIDGYWAATYVDYLYTADITKGYEDGSFRPGQNISRAQFSVMLYRYLGLEESRYADVDLPFADLAAIPDYALPAIRALYTEGIVNGSKGADGRLYFRPGDSLNRAQAAAMIGRTQPKGYATADLHFTDAAKIPGYADGYIRTMAAQGILGGYSDGSFRPGALITRGQMAKILYNLL